MESGFIAINQDDLSVGYARMDGRKALTLALFLTQDHFMSHTLL